MILFCSNFLLFNLVSVCCSLLISFITLSCYNIPAMENMIHWLFFTVIWVFLVFSFSPLKKFMCNQDMTRCYFYDYCIHWEIFLLLITNNLSHHTLFSIFLFSNLTALFSIPFLYVKLFFLYISFGLNLISKLLCIFTWTCWFVTCVSWCDVTFSFWKSCSLFAALSTMMFILVHSLSPDISLSLSWCNLIHKNSGLFFHF